MRTWLDHFGGMETWLNFLYAAYHDQPISMSLDFYRNEYHVQADNNRAHLNLDISRRVFDEKVRFTYALASRLEVECSGAYIEQFDTSQALKWLLAHLAASL